MGGHRMASHPPGSQSNLGQPTVTGNPNTTQDVVPPTQPPTGSGKVTSTPGDTIVPDSEKPTPAPVPNASELSKPVSPITATKSASSTSASDPLDKPVDIHTYRILMGLPGSNPPFPPPDIPVRQFFPSFLGLYHDPEKPTSIYFAIVGEERKAKRRYRLYDVLIYSCLFVQLALSAILVILAALPSQHHISLAILGGVNGVLAGILSLVKGQGMPMRLMKYADSLRQIREDIEWHDRELRAQTTVITLKKCQELRNRYETVREDEIKNSPDIWTTAANAMQPGAPGKTGASAGGVASLVPNRVPTAAVAGVDGTQVPIEKTPVH